MRTILRRRVELRTLGSLARVKFHSGLLARPARQILDKIVEITGNLEKEATSERFGWKPGTPGRGERFLKTDDRHA